MCAFHSRVFKSGFCGKTRTIAVFSFELTAYFRSEPTENIFTNSIDLDGLYFTFRSFGLELGFDSGARGDSHQTDNPTGFDLVRLHRGSSSHSGG